MTMHFEFTCGEGRRGDQKYTQGVGIAQKESARAKDDQSLAASWATAWAMATPACNEPTATTPRSVQSADPGRSAVLS